MASDHTSIIDAYIEDQQRLTAVERFASCHSRSEPAGRRYSHLLPASAPAPGQQYAFEVDLDRCSGCKACVAACHSLNGLDATETWRDVGLLVSQPIRARRNAPTTPLQHITTACHHCVDPACMNGCPVLAYDKDPLTGIVRHLDDQCIGCQYCALKCPYDAPKYNSRLGIVRKCDMCSNRLSAGEAPACAQACPSEAIKITLVDTSTVATGYRERMEPFLPGAPEPRYTVPTTRYVSRGKLNEAARVIAADASTLQIQPAHWPLVFMLVLSQASVGMTILAAMFPRRREAVAMALGVLCASMAASVFHLGRPFGAWRVFLGLKRSWLSREIVVFSAFLGLLAVCGLDPTFFGPAIACGIVGVVCSAMIYHDTQRELWRLRRGLTLFLGTAALLGLSAATLLAYPAPALPAIIIGLSAAKLAVEVSVLRHVTDRSISPLKKTALIVVGPLQSWAWLRMICVMLGGVAMPLAWSLLPASSGRIPIAAAGFLMLLGGECIERMFFFRAVAAPKMPGGVTA